MSPYQLHLTALQSQFEFRRDLERQRALAFVIAISLAAIAGLIIANSHW